MTDLSTTIAGVKFPACFMNASGALCVTREELTALGRSRAGAIVTKSMTVEPRRGNPEPRYYGFPGGSINSMGLPNLGYRAYAELIPDLKRFGKPVIASVAGLCEEDFTIIADAINDAGPPGDLFLPPDAPLPSAGSGSSSPAASPTPGPSPSPAATP